MSCNRENVTWKSRDGTWNRGFFDFHQTGEDYEWDVEYDRDTFNWVSVGHATAEEANDAWNGANPGGGMVIDTPSAETDRYDQMAKARLEQERKWDEQSRRQRPLYSWR